MTHFLLFLLFAVCVAIVFGSLATGDARARLLYGVKVFVEFVGIGFVLAWVFYFLPMS